LIRKIFKLKAGKESNKTPHFEGRLQADSGWIAADLGKFRDAYYSTKWAII
jgi:hypothetical protein